ncbi:MAG: hypothetical protein V1852_18535 [Pseudomonadota bacterium]
MLLSINIPSSKNNFRGGIFEKKDMAEKLGKLKLPHYPHALVFKMITNQLVEYIFLDNATIRLQKYRFTDKGQAWLTTAQERQNTL